MFSRVRFPPNPLALVYTACLAGWIVAVLSGGSSQARFLIQLVVLPVVLFGLSRLVINSIRLPRLITGIAALAALSGAVIQYSDVGAAPGALVLARLDGDPLGNETVIIRDKLRRAYGAGATTRIVTQERVFGSKEEASDFLLAQPRVGSLLWGTERRLNLSMRVPEPFSISSFPEGSVGRQFLARHKLKDVFLITGVPWIGISSEVDGGTAQFLARLMEPMARFSETIQSFREDVEFDRSVRNVAALRGRWVSNAPRAFPLWMSATYQLTQALAAPSLEGGDLACALASFKFARSNLKRKDNPTLVAALLNNQAVVYMMYADVSLDPKGHRSVARRLLLTARALREASGAFKSYTQVWGAVESNIAAFHVDKPRR